MWSLVWPLLRSWLLRRGLSLLVWLAAAAAALAVLLGARRAGRKSERLEQLRRYMEIRDAQLTASLQRPRTSDDIARLLRLRHF